MTTVLVHYKGSSKSGNYGHAGRRGKVGGSAPKSTIAITGIEKLPSDQQAEMNRILSELPERHLRGIVSIKVVPHIDHWSSPCPMGKYGQDLDGNGQILMAEDGLKDWYAPAVLLHEIGHHIMGANMGDHKDALFPRTSQIAARSQDDLNKYIKDLGSVGDSAKNHGGLGLENNEGKNTDEILAGLYRVQAMKRMGMNDYMGVQWGDYELHRDAPYIASLIDNMWEGAAGKELSVQFRCKGSAKSGNYSHAGRRGKVGGSAPGTATHGYQSAKYDTLQAMPSFQHFRDNDYTNWTNGKQSRTDLGADGQLEDILHDQGFDNLPELVNDAQFQQYVDAGEVPVYRGLLGGEGAAAYSLAGEAPPISAADMAEQFRSGKLYAGWGSYGGGTYTSDSKATAERYASNRDMLDDVGDVNGAVLAMTIRKDAKIIELPDAERMSNAYRDAIRKTAPEGIREALYDTGRFAAAKGYDVLVVFPEDRGESRKNDKYYIVLNRTAVRVLNHDLAVPGD